MYDEGARAWAQDIEAMHRNLEKSSAALKEASKRLERLRSKKMLDQVGAEVRALETQVTSLTASIATETEKFFQTVLGILPDSVVAIVDASGKEGQAVVASSMRVRTLKNGQLVVSVWGDLVAGETSDRLSNTLLMAAEAEGKRLNVLS